MQLLLACEVQLVTRGVTSCMCAPGPLTTAQIGRAEKGITYTIITD